MQGLFEKNFEKNQLFFFAVFNPSFFVKI